MMAAGWFNGESVLQHHAAASGYLNHDAKLRCLLPGIADPWFETS